MNYKDKRWLILRERVLKRDKHMCQHLLRYGKRCDATMVHHIYPADEYPQLAYYSWNLISLSDEAHEKMHDRKTHKLTSEGERLKKNVPPSLKNQFGL